jgi:hypothetical protein
MNPGYYFLKVGLKNADHYWAYKIAILHHDTLTLYRDNKYMQSRTAVSITLKAFSYMPIFSLVWEVLID